MIEDCVPKVQAGNKVLRQLNRILDKLCLTRSLKRGQSYSAGIKLRCRQTLVIVVSVDQKVQADRIDYLCRRHVDISSRRLFEIEGNEIEVVVRVQGVAIKFHVAFDL